jgi:methionyl-tRNA synthetase
MARTKKSNGAAVADQAHIDAEAKMQLEAAEAARVEQLTATKELAVKTMTGDLRDIFLAKLRYEQDKRPWSDRSENEQRETIHYVETAIQEAVRSAVEMIAAGGLPTIKATLDQVVVKDGLKLVLVMDRSNEQRHAIMDATGGTVLLVVADASNYMGERAPVKVTPDQGDIEQIAGVVHSSDDDDQSASNAPGWRADRDAFPPSASPLN